LDDPLLQTASLQLSNLVACLYFFLEILFHHSLFSFYFSLLHIEATCSVCFLQHASDCIFGCDSKGIFEIPIFQERFASILYFVLIDYFGFGS
jgi:hypothetical protein